MQPVISNTTESKKRQTNKDSGATGFFKAYKNNITCKCNPSKHAQEFKLFVSACKMQTAVLATQIRLIQ